MLENQQFNFQLRAGTYNKIVVTKEHIRMLDKQSVKCVNSNVKYSLFKGRNDKQACEKQCLIERFYRKCRYSPEVMFQHIIPKHWIKKMPPSFNLSFNKECREKYDSKIRQLCTKICPESCKQTQYLPSVFSYSIYKDTNRPHKTRIYLQYSSMLEVSVKERIKYTISDLLANLGGTMGPLTGFSVMSLLELVISFAIYCVYLFIR